MQQQLPIPIPKMQNLASPEIVRRQADTQKEAEFQELYKKTAQEDKNICARNTILTQLIVSFIASISLYIFITSINKNVNKTIAIINSIFMLLTQLMFRYLMNYISTKKIYCKVKFLLPYNDLRILGFVLRLADISNIKRIQNEIFAILLPLLETLTKEDVQMLWFGSNRYFHENQQDSLQRLAKHPRIRREFPELMQAIIVALYNFHTAKDKEVLEKIAKEKPKREAEQWIPKAAQSCLDAWETS
jgi:hypothetical protein